jgi:hypothetical protein
MLLVPDLRRQCRRLIPSSVPFAFISSLCDDVS